MTKAVPVAVNDTAASHCRGKIVSVCVGAGGWVGGSSCSFVVILQ